MTASDQATGGASVTVRYWAAARAAAGVAEEHTEPGSLEELLTRLGAQHGERLGRVLGYCSYLLDGTPLRDRATLVPAGAVLEVLPPFAGG